jgi:hypothetical protein
MHQKVKVAFFGVNAPSSLLIMFDLNEISKTPHHVYVVFHHLSPLTSKITPDTRVCGVSSPQHTSTHENGTRNTVPA